MIDGVLYSSNGIGLVEAFHPGTGKTVWIQQPFSDEPDRGLRGNSTRALAYWSDASDRRLFAIRGEYLVALDPRTGRPVPAWGAGGRVHLKPGLGPRATTYQSSSGPQVCGDVVMTGAQMTDAPQTRQQPPGDVQAFDVRTGKPRWTFHVMPQPGEVGNDTWERDSWAYSGQANLWSLISADEELGLAYFPLTSPTNDMYGGHRLGNNLFSDTLVCGQVRHRRTRLAFADRAPRSLGLRSAGGAGARRHHGRWPPHQGRRAGHQAGVRVRVRSHERTTRVADRRAAGAAFGYARRAHVGDAAVSHQAAAVRPAGRDGRRSDRFHAGAARAGAAAGEAVPDRSALYAAVDSRRRAGRDERDDSAARLGRRRRLAGRRVRSGDRDVLCRVDYRPVRGRPRQRRSGANRSRLRARPARLSAGPAGAPAPQAAVRPDHRDRPEQGRHRVDGRPTATARGTIRC